VGDGVDDAHVARSLDIIGAVPRDASPSTNSAGTRADRRQRILAAAADAIARNGITGMRVEEVAAAAGVSTPLLYYHFGNRTGLVNAAFEYASEQAPSTSLRVASDTRSGYEALEDALLAELDDRASVRDYAIVWGDVSAAAVFDAELRPAVRRVTREWQATVAAAIERGIADGSIRDEVDPDAVAELLIVLVDGFCVRWLSDSLDLSRARALLGLALEQLRAGPQHGRH
jgi:AcrR family transcriptional regulator